MTPYVAGLPLWAFVSVVALLAVVFLPYIGRRF